MQDNATALIDERLCRRTTESVRAAGGEHPGHEIDSTIPIAMPFMIQVLLPVYTNEGEPIHRARFAEVRRETTERFGGVTAYTRSPAEGTWEDDGRTYRDDVVIFEVMTDRVDSEWWRQYGETLAERFRQKEIVIRALAFDDLSRRSGGVSHQPRPTSPSLDR